MTDIEESQPADLFVKVPLSLLRLVKAGVIKPADAWLYVVQMMHMNAERAGQGDTKVWPSRPTMADWMGFKDTPSAIKGVDKHVERLEAAKLIKKTTRRRGGMRSRNLYTLNDPSSVRSPETGTTAPPAQTSSPDVVPAQSVVPEGGLRSPETGTHVVPKTGPELEEVELEEVVQDLSPRQAERNGLPTDPARAETRESDPPEPKTNPTHHPAVYEAMAAFGVEPAEAAVLVPIVVGMQIKKPGGPGWWRHVAGNGDLGGFVTAARREVAKTAKRATAVAERTKQPPLTVSTPPPAIKEAFRAQHAARAEARVARLAEEEEARRRREQILKEVTG